MSRREKMLKLDGSVQLKTIQNMSNGIRKAFLSEYGLKFVVIYSGLRQGFYRTKSEGYTDKLDDAGVWDLNNAIEATKNTGAEKEIEFFYLIDSEEK